MKQINLLNEFIEWDANLKGRREQIISFIEYYPSGKIRRIQYMEPILLRSPAMVSEIRTIESGWHKLGVGALTVLGVIVSAVFWIMLFAWILGIHPT